MKSKRADETKNNVKLTKQKAKQRKLNIKGDKKLNGGLNEP